MQYDKHIGMPIDDMKCGWPLTKVNVQKEAQTYRPFRDEIVKIDRIV